jgi:exodeoxyribonuclease III
MKIVTWNVNGIRAVQKKGLGDWLKETDPDILCLQETKAHPDQLEKDLREPFPYQAHWSAAVKKGYSGVALFLKKPPLRVGSGLGIEEFDNEGRTLIAEYENFILYNGYYPNGQHDLGRVPFKLKYSDAVLDHSLSLHRQKKKPIILAGDFNTAHQAIDLARPKENEGNTGFLPEERAWLDKLVSKGFIDIFRAFEPGPHHYTWWSYRAGARQKNIGWRIDYFFITPDLKDRIQKVYLQPKVMGSDHCPVIMEIQGC